MNVLITGATGLIGKEITKLCIQAGHTVHYLTTRKNAIVTSDQYQGFYWNPPQQEIDVACFEGITTIIHLAGATVSKRWSKDYKQEIVNSRLQTASLLFETLSTTTHTVRHFISASGISIYPSDLSNQYSETSTAISSSFLGQLVVDWEAAAQQFEQLQLKVSKVRIGLVLAAKGGAFPKMAEPIRKGVGAAFGAGTQWQSWIHCKDLARIFVHLMEHQLEGVYNGVAPNPVTNQELTAAIAKVYQKKIWLPNIPKFMMKLILGEMHELLFESQYVKHEKIETTGFTFEYNKVSEAVSAIALERK